MLDLIVFLAVLSILIVVHEAGHFFMARRLGVRVERFALGFGPKIASKTLGETEYMICACPLGGYVKMAGDDRSQCRGRPEEFYSHPVRHRVAIVLMGPLINFLFAYACFYVIFLAGFPMLAPKVGEVMEGMPAVEAGIRKGDTILQIDGRPIRTWEDIQGRVFHSEGRSLEILIERGARVLTRRIAPREKVITNIFGQREHLYLLGLRPDGATVAVRYGLLRSLGEAAAHLGHITSLTLRSLYYVATGALPAKDALAGPVRIFGLVSDAAHAGLVSLIYMMGAISASLAIFNLFPVPALDGGHLFIFVVEALRRRPLPAAVEEGMARVGFGLLMLLMLFVLYNDLRQTGLWDRAQSLIQERGPSEDIGNRQEGARIHDRQ